MKKINYWTALVIAYIMIITGMTIGDVGKIMCSEPYEYTWDLPIIFFGFMISIFILGYLSGKTDYKD